MNERIRIPSVIHRGAGASLLEALDRELSETSRPVMVLEGSPGTFCSGLDLEQGAEEHTDGELLGKEIRLFAECLKKIRFCAKPVLALVNGDASGGGLGLLCACDAVIATPDSRFAMPEVIFGLVPALIWPFVTERLSVQRARLFALSGEAATSEQALAWGLIDEVSPPDQMDAACSRWQRRLSRGLPSAVESLKSFSGSRHRTPLNEWLEQAIPLTVERLEDPLTRTRMERYLAGEAPWKDGEKS